VSAEVQLTVYYLDSSAMVKRYVEEAGTAWIETLCSDKANLVATAQISLVEVAAAFASKRRGDEITDEAYEQVMEDFIGDASSSYLLVRIDQPLLDEAIQLTRRQSLRGYDAVQLACALLLNRELVLRGLPPLILVSADVDLLVAADGEGLATENPNEHP
jgi:predicted nucleic acid-binding protein